jgi:hypothetical protein
VSWNQTPPALPGEIPSLEALIANLSLLQKEYQLFAWRRFSSTILYKYGESKENKSEREDQFQAPGDHSSRGNAQRWSRGW